MKLHRIYFDKSDIDLLFYRYDRNNDGRIAMSEVI